MTRRSVPALLRALSIACILVALPGIARANPDPAAPAPPWLSKLERGHALAGRIWQPATGRFLTPAELLAVMGQADVVLLGEKHDNLDHHRLQAWAVEQLIRAGRRPAVAFEMISTDKAGVIADFLRWKPGDVAGLGGALGWERTGWPEWSQYSPIAAAALVAGLPVVAANLPRQQARALAEGGGAPADLARDLGIDQPLAEPLASAMAAEIRASHCNALPEAAVAPMVLTQRARDATMARSVATSLKQGGIDAAVLIAGSGHARNDRGVPMYLRQQVPNKTSLAVAFLEVDAETTDPAAYARMYAAAELPFDVVWFTARTDDDDPCKAMVEHMRRRAQGKADTDKQEADKPEK